MSVSRTVSETFSVR